MGKCYFCKGETKERRIIVDYRWKDKLTIIENVPAEVCEQCGEKYFDAKVVKEMERLASTQEGLVRMEEAPVKEFSLSL